MEHPFRPTGVGAVDLIDVGVGNHPVGAWDLSLAAQVMAFHPGMGYWWEVDA